jgi:hypothetical protein
VREKVDKSKAADPSINPRGKGTRENPIVIDFIPYVEKLEDWHRMFKCPICLGTVINSEGKKYICARCGFSIDKPRCKECGSVRMYVSSVLQRDQITFACIDCKSGFNLDISQFRKGKV